MDVQGCADQANRCRDDAEADDRAALTHEARERQAAEVSGDLLSVERDIASWFGAGSISGSPRGLATSTLARSCNAPWSRFLAANPSNVAPLTWFVHL